MSFVFDFSAPLAYQKTKRLPLHLNYKVRRLPNLQARLKGRDVAIPQFELRDYTVRAVIDWVEVCLQLGQPTQFMHVQRAVAGVLGKIPFVTARSHVSSEFQLVVQEPSTRTLLEVEDALTQQFGLAGPISLTGVEISVDFTPVVPSENARHKMVGLLHRHMLPDLRLLTTNEDRPRFVWGKEEYAWAYALGPRNRPDQPAYGISSSERSAPVDATFYVGRKNGPVQWRVMDKILDRQNPSKDTRDELPDDEKRARIEVTLRHPELSRLGLRTLQDLKGFAFGRLQGDYFRFMLPTFATHPDGLPAVTVKRVEEHRRDRFKSAGVLGLALLDNQRLGIRRDAIALLRKRKQRSRPAIRAGGGTEQTFVAYQELCARIASALKKLGERERKGL